MNPIILFGVDADLRNCHYGRKECMICEEDIIKIDFTCLLVINEISISVIDSIKQEACEIHGNKIEVHALDAKDKLLSTS